MGEIVVQADADPGRALKSLAALGLELAEDPDLGHILAAVLERAVEATGAERGASYALGPDGRADAVVDAGLGASAEGLPEGLTPVLEGGAPLRVPAPPEGWPDGVGPLLAVPFRRFGRVVGAVALAKPPGDAPFDAVDAEVVSVMASMASTSIDNVRHLAAERERAERGNLLRAIATRVRRSLETSEVLSATAQTLARAVGADRCFIRLVDDEGIDLKLGPVLHEWVAPGVEPLAGDAEVHYPITTLAAMTRSTQWSEDLERDPRLGDVSKGEPRSVPQRAVLATPLEWAGNLLGVVTLHSDAPRPWSSSDISLVEAAAREVSIGIDHARRYRLALNAAERLRDVDQMRSDFVSIVSHELRSPMTVIAGISDILEKRADRLTDDQRRELVETLGREARRLRRLVSEVLDLETYERGVLELQVGGYDIVELAREAVADAVEAHRTTVAVDLDDPKLTGDRDRIKQVMLNLITNASKFSGELERITVRVGAREDGVLVSVTDQGPGMSAEQQSRLFERFSRVHDGYSKPGSGLGLFLSKKIVEGHGGTMWVQSAPGQGSTFGFWLPREPPAIPGGDGTL